MRVLARLAIILAAATLCLCAGDVLAQAKGPALVSGMSAKPDIVQLQIVAWEWIVATVSSTNFLIGLGAGVLLAEGARIAWRGLMSTLALLTGTFQMAMRYRLAVAGIVVGIAYAATQWHVFG